MKKVIKVKIAKKENKTIYIDPPFIKLDSLLKLCGVAQTGGHAKIIIQNEEVKVNDEICDQRGKKIKAGDRVTYENTVYEIEEKN